MAWDQFNRLILSAGREQGMDLAAMLGTKQKASAGHSATT
jgi:hypothetical protein